MKNKKIVRGKKSKEDGMDILSQLLGMAKHSKRIPDDKKVVYVLSGKDEFSVMGCIALSGIVKGDLRLPLIFQTREEAQNVIDKEEDKEMKKSMCIVECHIKPIKAKKTKKTK